MEYIAQGGDSLPYLVTWQHVTRHGPPSFPFQLENCYNKTATIYFHFGPHCVAALFSSGFKWFSQNDLEFRKERNKKAYKSEKREKWLPGFRHLDNFFYGTLLSNASLLECWLLFCPQFPFFCVFIFHVSCFILKTAWILWMKKYLENFEIRMGKWHESLYYYYHYQNYYGGFFWLFWWNGTC